VVGRFRKPPTVIPDNILAENHLRLRINPDVTIAMGMTVMGAREEIVGQPAEMVASRLPQAGEMDAYERVLGAAMDGDATLFARQDYVEEAWRIVDPVLAANTPVHSYEPNTWGPGEVAQVTPPGGWRDPIVGTETSAADPKAA